jgi:hypothetical protein
LYHNTNSYIVNDTGHLYIDSAADIILDAGGGDVILQGGTTQYAAFTKSGTNLIIQSGTTAAATFSGANVTFAGTLASGAITSSGAITFSDMTLQIF